METIFTIMILLSICSSITFSGNTEQILVQNKISGMNIEWFEDGILTKNLEDGENWIVFAKDGLYGYMDKNQTIKVKPQFDGAYPFSEGLASIYVFDKSKEIFFSDETDCWYGFINASGELVIPCIYDGASNFYEGLAVVRDYRDGPEHYINKKGEKVFGDKTFPMANPFSERYAAVVVDSGMPFPTSGVNKWTYINKMGEYATNMEFEEAGYFNNGYAKVKNNGKWGKINSNFELVVDYLYDDITSLPD